MILFIVAQWTVFFRSKGKGRRTKIQFSPADRQDFERDLMALRKKPVYNEAPVMTYKKTSLTEIFKPDLIKGRSYKRLILNSSSRGPENSIDRHPHRKYHPNPGSG
jgi:hypothetical protein